MLFLNCERALLKALSGVLEFRHWSRCSFAQGSFRETGSCHYHAQARCLFSCFTDHAKGRNRTIGTDDFPKKVSLLKSWHTIGTENEKGYRNGSPFLLILLVARDGVEPPTRGFSVPIETILNYDEYSSYTLSAHFIDYITDYCAYFSRFP
jgi:hypothetical protein